LRTPVRRLKASSAANEELMPRFTERQRAALASAMQEEVFQVASKILREEGFAGLTMERIAKQAGVARGTLYNYFADSEAVLRFVQAQVVEPMIEAVEELAAADIAPAEKLEAIVELMIDRINDDRALALALFSTRELIGPRAAHKLKIHNRFLTTVQRILAEGVAKGQLREIEKPVLAKLFLGAISGLIEHMLLSGEEVASGDLAPVVMDVLMHGMQRSHGGHG